MDSNGRVDGILIVLGALTAASAWTMTYLYNPAMGRSLMGDADLMYLEQLFLELFQRGGSLSQWHLTPAPYFFPDMLGYFALRPLVPNVFWAFYFFSLLQSVLLLALAMGLAYRVTGSKNAVLLTEASCLSGLALGLGKVPPYTFVYTPTFHAGAFLVGLGLLWLTASVLQSKGGSPWLVTYGLLVALGTASDLFLVVTIVLPLCLSLFVFLLLTKEASDRTGAIKLLGTAAVFTVLGIGAAKLLTKSTAPPLLDTTLSEAFQRLVVVPPTLLRILQVNLVPGLLIVAFYGLLFCRLGYYVLSLRKEAVRPKFPIWEFFLVLSTFGLVLFLGLRDMLHFPDPDTSRYLLTVVWLPISLVWIPFQSSLDSPRAGSVGRVMVVCSLVAILCVSAPSESRSQANYTPEWVVALDAHLEELEKNGRVLKFGVSTYWQAKIATTHSRRNISVAQFTPDLAPYLWIATVRWYRPTYDFALVDDSDEDRRFLKNLVEKCGPPELVMDCSSNVKLVVFPQEKLELRLPEVSPYIWGVAGLTPGTTASRSDRGITSAADVVESNIFVYGPYAQLTPGQYEAVFVVQRSEGRGKGRIVCEVAEGEKIWSSRELDLETWVQDEERKIVLGFDLKGEAGNKRFEFRMWKEGAYSVTLREFKLSEL